MTGSTQVIKRAAKWILDPVERKRAKREAKVRRDQDKFLSDQYPASARKLILFFLDSADVHTGKETVSGGLLSINSIFEETVRVKDAHGAEVIICTVEGAYLYFEFSTFKSPQRVLRYEQLESYFRSVEEIIVHIPEFIVEYVLEQFQRKRLGFLTSRKLHINILNQNIRLMPAAEIVAKLRPYASLVTQTTAHKRYATAQKREEYGMPLHHFSTFIAPERYTFRKLEEKKKTIAFSPDDPEKNAIVIEKLRNELPDYEIVVIGGMTYEQFKEFISRTMFTFTFGEGLDGYYCETVLTGGICFAVFNEEFFTPDFGTLETVHKSFETLLEGCVAQIREMEREEIFAGRNRKQFKILTDQYKFTTYQDNIRKFYLGEYTFG